MTNYVNLDAQDSFFLENELVDMKNRVFETLSSPLSGELLVPVDSTTNTGAEAISYDVMDGTGTVIITSDYVNTTPVSNVTAERFTSPIVGITGAYYLTIQEIRAARFANKPINERKMAQVFKVMRLQQNKITFYGDAKYNVPGWLTNAQVDNQLVSGGDVGARQWINKDSDTILEDMFECVNAAKIFSDGAIDVNRLVMPIAQHALISSKRVGTNTDTTVLEFFRRNKPEISIFAANELKGAFANNTDGMVAYEYNRNYFWQERPQDFETLPPQSVDWTLKINCHSRHGGTIIVEPDSQKFRRGI